MSISRKLDGCRLLQVRVTGNEFAAVGEVCFSLTSDCKTAVEQHIPITFELTRYLYSYKAAPNGKLATEQTRMVKHSYEATQYIIIL